MKRLTVSLAAMAAVLTVPLAAQDTAAPASTPVTMASQTTGSPDARAAAMLAQMTQAEKLTLLMGYFGADFEPGGFKAPAEARIGSAGYVPGIARLGIPAQWQTDAGLGVATQGGAKEKRGRTGLPSGLLTASTWDRDIAYSGGRMIGHEARSDGFNVLLAGSVNLLREPRNGRNFEYAGEDPVLAGVIVGEQIRGIQSNDIISTIKHFAANDQETDRFNVDVTMDEGALRMSDLLAFQIAYEIGEPGSTMCAYNKVEGDWACENAFLLTEVLRNEWDWPGYVMSDWGAVHSTAKAANSGLDQESGFGLQSDGYFSAEKLEAAVADGSVSERRIDTMALRVLRTMFAHGLMDNPVKADTPIDFAASRAVSQADAEAGIVLLKNEGNLLPLAATAKRIAVIGGHADKGVLSGGGSSQVYPGGGFDGENAVPGLEPTTWPGPVVYFPSSPLEELRKALPDAQIDFASGDDPATAAALAEAADLAIVFGTQWSSESIDVAMKLDGEQDATIAAVAAAQPKTVVVLQNNGPVAMPWVGSVPAIVEAWYPGRMGGAAIARVLTGAVNPSGHLPATFPVNLQQLPHPASPPEGAIEYSEGELVGYKWFDAKGLSPLFPFGHGLSYTTFGYSGLSAVPSGEGLVASVVVTNTGQREGSDAVQVYVSGPDWKEPRRLGGFAKVELAPGESRRVGVTIDPRVLAHWSDAPEGWHRAAGTYTISTGNSSRDLTQQVTVELPEVYLAPGWRPSR